MASTSDLNLALAPASSLSLKQDGVALWVQHAAIFALVAPPNTGGLVWHCKHQSRGLWGGYGSFSSLLPVCYHHRTSGAKLFFDQRPQSTAGVPKLRHGVWHTGHTIWATEAE